MSAAIVVGIDGADRAWTALAWAADDAARRGRPLRIVHVREPWQPERPLAGTRLTLSERNEALLSDAVERVRTVAPEVETTAVLVTGAVVERLRTEGADADSLVLGSRGRSAAAGLMLGSTGFALAGHVRCPVVIVHEPPGPARGEIVVGYDGSADAEAALAYGLEQADARGARVRVVYGRQVPVLSPHPVGYGPLPGADLGRQLEAAMAPWREMYPDVPIEDSFVDRHPVTALVRASSGADLAVVGSRGLSRLTATVLGTVSHGVLQRAHCPVAVVRAPWRPSSQPPDRQGGGHA
ncbi:universal stress protein [Nonomuraea longispora]|uniref:Universal stress protein n=1 Tax=Nonomuraea longispora TaxID=1848320 RepID=A0A4R4N277_9ACTN|nr:universal stress protein [Nonomuraea longispora]TDC02778.1 universal stress protein [Nonomuraea longispora]